MLRGCLVALCVGVVACIADPQDPKTWIKKLDDVREQKEAVRQLVRLKDPAAVEPLMALYKKTKDPEHLKAFAQFKDKRSVDALIEALEYSEDSFDNAAAAATALGDIGDPKAVPALAKVLDKKLAVKTRANVVKLETMKSLARLKDPKAVDALVKVLETSADEQDFFLNLVAAQSLADFADAKAVPALVRGLFMMGRGSDVYQPCRTALLSIGKPAVPALIEALEHKNTKLEEDAKKYEFRPGVIDHKLSLILGDLRAKEAVPQLTALLKKPAQGDSHRGALYALGMIADPASTKDLVGMLSNGAADYQSRVSAAEALNLSGDLSALPAIFNVAKTGDVMKDGEKYPDVRVAAAIAYSRLAGADAAAPFAAFTATETAAKAVFEEGVQRLDVAKACNKDVACYAKSLDDAVLAKQEKAAFMLARMGKEGLPALTKKLSTKEPIVRFAVLFGLGRNADKSSADVIKALDEQIDLDKTKPPFKVLVDEMRAVRAQIRGR